MRVDLKSRLANLQVGSDDADAYRLCVLEILKVLFDPDLVDGHLEEESVVFSNASNKSFWGFLKWEHSGSLLAFETKNTEALDKDDLSKTSAALGGRLGSLGFVVMRSAPTLEELDKSYAFFNGSLPRRVILILSDSDLKAMLDLRAADRDPSAYIETLYRGFRASVQ